jgi:preprotein translocase subunit YajC
MNKCNMYLRIALIGIASLLLCPLTEILTSRWVQQLSQAEYLLIITIGVYAMLGIFLLWVSRKQEDHIILIMKMQKVLKPGERRHVAGGVPAILLTAIVITFPASCKVVPGHDTA